MEGIFFFKADFGFDNKEVRFYLLRKWEFVSQASAALKPARSRLLESGASWLQCLGKVARSGAGFQYKFVKVAHSVVWRKKKPFMLL